MGEDISPTMISGIYKQNGTTQDKLNVITYRKQGHPQNAQQGQGWQETNINDTLNVFDSGETRTPTLVLENHPQDSRLKIKEDGIFQTMGARGGHGIRAAYTYGIGERYGSNSKKINTFGVRETSGLSRWMDRYRRMGRFQR